MVDIPEKKTPPVQPAQTEEHEFSSRNVRSNIAPIFHILPKIQINYLSGLMVFVYFITATLGLINLMLVIVPRIRNDMGHDDLPEINATFFGGIIQFQNPVEYADYLYEMTEDNENTFKMFVAQVYALGHINAYKNKHMKRAILFFGTAILSELVIIMAMAWSLTWSQLFNQ